MNKIITMCVAGVLSVAAQAASVNWTITGVQDTLGRQMVGKGLYTAYLFVTENTTGVTLTTTTFATVADLLAAGKFDSLSEYSAAANTNNGAGRWSGATGLTGFEGTEDSPTKLSAFVVIIDNVDVTKAEKYLLVNDGAVETLEFKSDTSAAMTMSFGSQSEGTWQAVPEPTSGLLLLMGMGVLALRRKQK